MFTTDCLFIPQAILDRVPGDRDVVLPGECLHKSEDSSIENDDSSIENDDSSTEK